MNDSVEMTGNQYQLIISVELAGIFWINRLHILKKNSVNLTKFFSLNLKKNC